MHAEQSGEDASVSVPSKPRFPPLSHIRDALGRVFGLIPKQEPPEREWKPTEAQLRARETFNEWRSLSQSLLPLSEVVVDGKTILTLAARFGTQDGLAEELRNLLYPNQEAEVRIVEWNGSDDDYCARHVALYTYGRPPHSLIGSLTDAA